MIRVILDRKTLRVIYYSSDINERLVVHYDTMLFDYTGDLPATMTPNNCWNFKLVGDKFIEDTPQSNDAPTLLEHNRHETINYLKYKINTARQWPTLAGPELLQIKLNDIRTGNMDFLNALATAAGLTLGEYIHRIEQHDFEYSVVLRNTDIQYEYFNRRIQNAESSEELMSIRQELENTDVRTYRL